MKNLKITLLSLALVAGSTVLLAQKMQMGIKAGLNGSTQSFLYNEDFLKLGIDNQNLGPIPALHMGLSFRMPMGENLYLNVEPMYSLKGSSGSRWTPDLLGANIRMHYLSLPLLMDYMPGERFFIEGGIEPSYLLDARVKILNLRTELSKSFWAPFDFSGVLGLGYHFSPQLKLNTRLVWGFQGLFDVEFTDANGTPQDVRYDFQNRTLQVGMTYFLKSN
jgi:hypothetical protein